MSLSEYLASAQSDGAADADTVSIIQGLAQAAKDIDHIIRRNG